MSIVIPPGERSFYKYMSPDTALIVLANQTFRYSSPLIFNDPFDIQCGLHFDFAVDELHEKVLEKLESLSKNKEKPKVDISDPWGRLVELFWENHRTHGFPKKRWEKDFAMSFELLANEMEKTRMAYIEAWTEILPTMRVFCVSEEKDNLLMWAHYAKDHTGIVAEVLSLPEEDNPLSVARPINYVTDPPPFFTEDEWIDDILLQKRLDQAALFRRYAETKSKHWAYEKEWRVWYPEDKNHAEKWFDMPIRKSELAAVYLGCRAGEPFNTDIQDLVRNNFPSARIFRAKKNHSRYCLSYEEI